MTSSSLPNRSFDDTNEAMNAAQLLEYGNAMFMDIFWKYEDDLQIGGSLPCINKINQESTGKIVCLDSWNS